MKIEFLDRDQAAAALVDDRADPYFSRMTPWDAALKTKVDIRKLTDEDQIRRAYRGAAREFDRSAVQTLTAFLNHVERQLAALPLVAEIPWRLALVGGPLEGRASFTRGDTIFLSSRGLAWTLRSRRTVLLLHEHCHVAQRRHRDRFARAYREVFDAVQLEPSLFLEAAPWLSTRLVLNPDALDWWAIESSGKWLAPALLVPRRRAWSPLLEALLPTPMWLTRRVGLELSRQGDAFALERTPAGDVAFTDHGPLFLRTAMFRRRQRLTLAYDHPNEVMAHLWPGVILEKPVIRPHLRELVEKLRRWWSTSAQRESPSGLK